MQPQNQHDACEDCGKRTDGLMTCYFHDGETTKLCPDCIKDSGFCLGCGNYCAGMESFDIFPKIKGYCSDCADEIESEFGEDEDDYDDNWYVEPDFDQEEEDNNPNDSRNL
jgi:hypothetical protein